MNEKNINIKNVESTQGQRWIYVRKLIKTISSVIKSIRSLIPRRPTHIIPE